MLEGTSREPGEVVCVLPPDLVECTVEKVAINAVMAGCLPEYLPVVLTAVEAAATSRFNIHGISATTYFTGPVMVVNGPIRRRIGMNSGINALGQGTRANLTIWTSPQPGGQERGRLPPRAGGPRRVGKPGKALLLLPRDRKGLPGRLLAVARGFSPDDSTVTLFAGHGPIEIVDQKSRHPESLARTSLCNCA